MYFLELHQDPVTSPPTSSSRLRHHRCPSPQPAILFSSFPHSDGRRAATGKADIGIAEKWRRIERRLWTAAGSWLRFQNFNLREDIGKGREILLSWDCQLLKLPWQETTFAYLRNPHPIPLFHNFIIYTQIFNFHCFVVDNYKKKNWINSGINKTASIYYLGHQSHLQWHTWTLKWIKTIMKYKSL